MCLLCSLPGKNGIADWLEVKIKIKSNLLAPAVIASVTDQALCRDHASWPATIR